MLDANQVWGVDEAIRSIDALREVKPWWIEEPTSPDDVLGWLRDHYREHVEQCPELIASWRAMS